MNYYVNKQNDDFFTSFFNDLFEDRNTYNLMKTDLIEKEDRYVLFIDLPGYVKENIQLSYKNDYLTITAHAEKEENVKYLHRERTKKDVSRRYYIGEVSEKAIKASFENGVLKVEILKEEPEKKDEKKIIQIG